MNALELNEDLPFQRRRWAVERVGWVVLGAVCMAGGLGLLGPGVLSAARAQGPESRVEYERFTRASHETRLRVQARPTTGTVAEASIGIVLPAAYLDRMEVHRISPQPGHAERDEDGASWCFPIPAGSGGVMVEFVLRPRRPGGVSAEIGIGTGVLALRQFILP